MFVAIPDRDAGGAVDEEVREAGREHRGLATRLVVVRPELDVFASMSRSSSVASFERRASV
jgi:hypothetical protein